MSWKLQQLLRSQRAEELLNSALASSGLTMQSWQLERIYSQPLPGGRGVEVSARFQVRIEGHRVSLVASTRQLDQQQRTALGAVRADSAVGQLHVWAHPADPELPGLAVAEDPAALAQRLSPVLGTSVTVVGTDMLVLRPLRRAVYRVRLTSPMGERTVFVKVFRPKKMAELLRRHAACSMAPRAADAGQGLLVIEAASGRALAQLLHQPGAPAPHKRFDPQLIFSALDSLTDQALQLPLRQPPAVRYRSFTEPLVAAGADRSRLQRLISRIDASLLPVPGPVVPTHGDFHPANLFLTPDARELTALIDTDTVGPGFRADDAAMFIAHLIALPSFDSSGYLAAEVLTKDLWAALKNEHPAADLAVRTAASLISIAPGARSPEQLEYYLRAAESLVPCD